MEYQHQQVINYFQQNGSEPMRQLFHESNQQQHKDQVSNTLMNMISGQGGVVRDNQVTSFQTQGFKTSTQGQHKDQVSNTLSSALGGTTSHFGGQLRDDHNINQQMNQINYNSTGTASQNIHTVRGTSPSTHIQALQTPLVSTKYGEMAGYSQVQTPIQSQYHQGYEGIVNTELIKQAEQGTIITYGEAQNQRQINQNVYEITEAVPVQTQVIEKHFEVEKPVVYEKIIEQEVEVIVEKEIMIQKTDKVDSLTLQLQQLQGQLNKLQQENYNYEERKRREDAELNELRAYNKNLLIQVQNKRNQPVQVQEILIEEPFEQTVEVYQDVYIEKPVYVEKPVYTEKITEVKNYDRVNRLKQEISRLQGMNLEAQITKVPRYETIERIIEEEVLEVVENPVYIEKPVYQDVHQDTVIPNIVEKIVEVPRVEYRDREVVVAVDVITEIPVENIVTEYIEKEVVQYIEQVEVIERPYDDVQRVPVEVIVENKIPVQVEKIVQKKVPRQYTIENIIEKKKDFYVENLVNRRVEVSKWKEVPEYFDVVEEVIKEVPVYREEIIWVDRPVSQVQEKVVEVYQETQEIDQIDKVVYKEVPVPQKRQVVKDVYVEKPVERIVKERVENPVVQIEERIVSIDVPFETIEYIEVPNEIIKQVNIDKPVKKIVERYREIPVEKKQIVYVDKPVIETIEKIVPVYKTIYKDIEVQQPFETIKEVYKKVPSYKTKIEYIDEVQNQVVDKIIEVPVTVTKVVDIQNERIVENRRPVEKIVEIVQQIDVYVDVPEVIEHFKEVLVDKIVFKERQVPVDKIVKRQKQVPIPVLQYVDKPYQVEQLQENKETRYYDQEFVTEVPQIQKFFRERPVEIKKMVDVPEIVYQDKHYTIDRVNQTQKVVPKQQVVTVDKEYDVQQINKVAQTVNVTNERVKEVEQIVKADKLHINTIENIVERPVLNVIEKKIPFQVDKLIEQPEEIVKTIYYQDNAKIAELEDQCEALYQKKSQPTYVELVHQKFERKYLSEEESQRLYESTLQQTKVTGHTASTYTAGAGVSAKMATSSIKRDYGSMGKTVIDTKIDKRKIEHQGQYKQGGLVNIPEVKEDQSVFVSGRQGMTTVVGQSGVQGAFQGSAQQSSSIQQSSFQAQNSFQVSQQQSFQAGQQSIQGLNTSNKVFQQGSIQGLNSSNKGLTQQIQGLNSSNQGLTTQIQGLNSSTQGGVLRQSTSSQVYDLSDFTVLSASEISKLNDFAKTLYFKKLAQYNKDKQGGDNRSRSGYDRSLSGANRNISNDQRHVPMTDAARNIEAMIEQRISGKDHNLTSQSGKQIADKLVSRMSGNPFGEQQSAQSVQKSENQYQQLSSQYQNQSGLHQSEGYGNQFATNTMYAQPSIQVQGGMHQNITSANEYQEGVRHSQGYNIQGGDLNRSSGSQYRIGSGEKSDGGLLQSNISIKSHQKIVINEDGIYEIIDKNPEDY